MEQTCCPKCKRPINGAATCPYCGSAVKNDPASDASQPVDKNRSVVLPVVLAVLSLALIALALGVLFLWINVSGPFKVRQDTDAAAPQEASTPSPTPEPAVPSQEPSPVPETEAPATPEPAPVPALSLSITETAPASRKTIAANSLNGFTVGVKTNGTVVIIGKTGGYGEDRVARWTNIVSVDTGGWHTVGLKEDGTVVAVGYNEYGQCSVSDWTDIVAIASGPRAQHTLGLESDGTVVATGLNDYGQCYVQGWTDIVAIAAGMNHTVGLKSDGTVVATGDASSGQCDIAGWRSITAIAAGSKHTVGLKADGTVVAVGSNEYGQCNVSDWTDIVAVEAGSGNTFGLKADGTVVACGSNGSRQCNVSGWTDIVSIAAGSSHTVGLKSNGTAVAVGANNYGQCDVSEWKDLRTPVSAEAPVTNALRKTDQLSNVHIETTFLVDLSLQVGPEDAASSFRINNNFIMDVQKDPHLVRTILSATSQIGTEQNVASAQIYTDYTDEESPVSYYSTDEGITWAMEKGDILTLSPLDYFLLLYHAEGFQMTGTDTLNGRAVTVYTGFLDGSYAQQIMLYLILTEVDFSFTDIADPSSLIQVPVTVFVDDESGCLAYYSIDLTDLFRESISEDIGESKDQRKGEEVTMTVATYTIEGTLSQFDSVPPIEIPEAALASPGNKPPQQNKAASVRPFFCAYSNPSANSRSRTMASRRSMVWCLRS